MALPQCCRVAIRDATLWAARHRTGDTPPGRYVAMFNDSEAHHRAALDGFGVALRRVTRARLLLDSGQLIALSPHLLKTRWSHWLV